MAASRALDVQSFLNQHRFSGFQWAIFAMCFFIVMLDGFDTAAIGYIAPSLIGEWGVSRPALGPVLSAALFGLATGAFLAGPLADRLGAEALGQVARNVERERQLDVTLRNRRLGPARDRDLGSPLEWGSSPLGTLMRALAGGQHAVTRPSCQFRASRAVPQCRS